MSWEEPEGAYDDLTDDWLWDLEDSYDVGVDEPVPATVGTSDGRVVRKHLRSPGDATLVSGAPLDESTAAYNPVDFDFEGGAADASVRTEAQPFFAGLAHDSRLMKWAIAAAVVVVLGAGGVGWAVGLFGSSGSGRGNVAISTPVTAAAPQAVTAVSSPTSVGTNIVVVPSTATTVPVPTSLTVGNALSTTLTSPTTPPRTKTTTTTTTKTAQPPRSTTVPPPTTTMPPTTTTTITPATTTTTAPPTTTTMPPATTTTMPPATTTTMPPATTTTMPVPTS